MKDENLQVLINQQNQLLALNANLDIEIDRLQAKKTRTLEDLKEIAPVVAKEMQARKDAEVPPVPEGLPAVVE